MAEELIGHVTHWYGGIGVAGVHMDRGQLHVGDLIHVVGHTSDAMQRVDSMEVERNSIGEARAGEDIGIKLAEHVRQHDKVYLVH